jgi:TM2 domain-containing membrane protein YozV
VARLPSGEQTKLTEGETVSDPFGDFSNPPTPTPTPAVVGKDVSGNKIAAGLLGIFLGALGIHKFILGYNKEGLIMLLVSILTCGIGAIPMGIIGFIEGIIYLTKSDDEFRSTYSYGAKGWF